MKSSDPDYIYNINSYRRESAVNQSINIHRESIKAGTPDIDCILSDARKIAAFVLNLPKTELHSIGEKSKLRTQDEEK